MTQNFNKPFTNKSSWGVSKPVPTSNVYNSFGVKVARAIDDDTAALIADALNAYELATGLSMS